MFCRYDILTNLGFTLYSGGIVVTILLATQLQQATREPFGYGVSACFTVWQNDGTVVIRFVLTILVLLWVCHSIRLGVLDL